MVTPVHFVQSWPRIYHLSHSDHVYIFADHTGSSSEEETCPDPEATSELSASEVRDGGNNHHTRIRSRQIVDVSSGTLKFRS